MEASPLLHASHVVKRYGDVVALDGVSLTVPVRERLALVGESGSGKTTLLRTFNRMVVPDEGSVRVRGVDVANTDPVGLRRSVGYVQQEGGLLPHWTVLRNVAMVPRLLEREDAAGLAAEALRLVGMEPSVFGTRWPRELSGGQRQRVALARAVAARPDVILMDEPFGAVDAITRSDLQEAFRELVERLGVTVVLVTHDLREAFLLADRVAVMRAGRVEGVAAPDTLAGTPPTPYVAELLRRAGVA
ncbi:MAG: ATP-binding cassette domain-containing protein [Gemmatimonadota bacterium]|jgi:osmoprotectant transport system ATP-binding protein